MTFQFRVYLDLDGVIHAPNPNHPEVEEFEVFIDSSRYLREISSVRFAPAVIKKLDDIRNIYNVELVWLTTWNEDSHVLKLPTYFRGLEGGRVIPPVFNHEAKDKKEWTQWKADAIIREQTETPIPFIWVDDNAHLPHSEPVRKATNVVPQLHLTTVSDSGLTVEDLETIEIFLQEIQKQAA